MALLIRHARVLTLAPSASEGGVVGAVKPRRGASMRELGVISRGDVLMENGVIAAVGTGLPLPAGAEVIEADGRVLMPGFVDCHTHACWAGDRLDEWDEQASGASGAGATKRKDGLLMTVLAVRESTRKQLAAGLRTRLDLMLRAGTTTAEVKSGYGLTLEAELKMLHAIQRASQEWPGTIVGTALLGHGIEGDAAAYTRNVVRETLPAVWHEFPGIAIDACCAEDAWPVEACVRLFERARKHGLPVRVQTDGARPPGMIAEALNLHARSIDHLEAATKEDLVAIAGSDTCAVMLPATSFHLRRRYPRAGAFVDSGGLLALATNYGPGNGPAYSMGFVIALAVRECGLTVAEAITASTVNAAAVLGLNDRGTIETGRRADLILLRHRDERMLVHEIGGNAIDAVICGGRKVSG